MHRQLDAQPGPVIGKHAGWSSMVYTSLDEMAAMRE